MNPLKDNELKSLVIETRCLEEQIGKLLLKVDENKEKLKEHFDATGEKEVRVELPGSNNVNIVCKKFERTNIKYDAEKLKKRVDNEIFLEITKRVYTIKDINKMIEMVRHAGVSARSFKELIDASVSIDNQAVKRLYDAGEISMKQLKGAFTATISKSIKITEEKSE